MDDGLRDIVAEGYDAGLRLESSLEGDMIALRVGPPLRAALVAAPAYLAAHPAPAGPADLGRHRLIAHLKPDGRGSYPWPFEEAGRTVRVQPEGMTALSDSDLVLEAAVAGLGLACVFEDLAAPALGDGRLVRLLEPLTAAVGRYALYHPSRRQAPPALMALIAALRSRRRQA